MLLLTPLLSLALLVTSVVSETIAKSQESGLTGTIKEKEAVNCGEAGWTSCCSQGKCLATAGQCYCDITCHEFGDCCDDIDSTCPLTTQPPVCTDGRIQVTEGQFKLCTNGTLKNMCDLPKETIISLDHEGILKRQTGDVGSGGGTGNLVEIGFANCSYTVGESESSVVVCVEVKSGELTPAETALATVSTLPGTALADVDYESAAEDVVFDGNTFNDPFCIEISIIDDAIYEPVEQFSLVLSSSSPTVTLDEVTVSATVSITNTDIAYAGDSCAEVGLSTDCCVGQVDQCQSLNSTCYCDKSCFKRRDCCEDIFMYVVEMEASSVQVIEGSTVEVCAVLTGRFEKTEDNVVVSVNFIDSQFAVRGEDYEVNSTEMVFPAVLLGQLYPGDTAVQCISIDIAVDGHVEGEHVFTVEIASVSPQSVVQCSASSNTTVLILDSDVAEVSLVPLPSTSLLEKEPMMICVRVGGVDYLDTPLSTNITVTSGQDVLYNSQVVFAVGEVSSGRIECRNVSLDNDVLEWSWQLTVELEQPHHNQHIILKDPYNLPLIVIDDEVDVVSVHFESASEEVVTEGHRTVVSVVLEGVPDGGMSRDLSVSLQLDNGTAEIWSDFTLGDGSSLNSTDAPTLVFHRGSSRSLVESRQCVLVETYEVSQCREQVGFNLTVTNTTPPVKLQEPLTASVVIRDDNTSCLCPTPTGCPQLSNSDRESLYFTLLLAVSALAALSLSGLAVLLIVLFCYCRHQKHRFNKAAAMPVSDRGVTIQNLQAEDHTDHSRTKTLFSLGSATYDISERERDREARKRAVRSMMIHQGSQESEDDYLSLRPASAANVLPRTTLSSVHHDYEEPVLSTRIQPSSTLL